MDDAGTQRRRLGHLLAGAARVVLAVAITALVLGLAGWLLMTAPRH